jgi:hypothetical protein
VPAISNKRFIQPTMLRDPSRMFLPVGESAPTERALLVDQGRERTKQTEETENRGAESPVVAKNSFCEPFPGGWAAWADGQDTVAAAAIRG